MHIVCPHCTTSYAINPATLGAAGRTVRCSRCKEIWLARPEDATELAVAAPAMAEASAQAGADDAAGGMGSDGARRRRRRNPRRRQPLDFGRLAAEAKPRPTTPTGRRSPSDGMQATDGASAAAVLVPQAFQAGRRPRPHAPRSKSFVSPAMACAAMGALVLALMIWRVEVVRLLPQTATSTRWSGWT